MTSPHEETGARMQETGEGSSPPVSCILAPVSLLFDPGLFEATQDHRRVLVAGVVDVLAGRVEEIDVVHPDPVVPVQHDVLDLVVDLFSPGRVPGVPPG